MPQWHGIVQWIMSTFKEVGLSGNPFATLEHGMNVDTFVMYMKAVISGILTRIPTFVISTSVQDIQVRQVRDMMTTSQEINTAIN